VIAIVIDFLVQLQVEVVQYLVNGVALDPQDVPVLTFNLSVSPLFECIKDAVLKCRFELNRGAERSGVRVLTSDSDSALS
jgi:hypothetical protein